MCVNLPVNSYCIRGGMPPYVGMARKQNGGYNASISVQTPIFHLVVNSTHLKTVRSALWHCPNSTVALRLLENVVKVMLNIYPDYCF